jgi:sec-independent protein translocase protein TatA
MGLDNPLHLAFLLALLLVVFGAKRLPEMGRSIGSGMRGFKDALSGEDSRPALAAVEAPAQPAATVAPAETVTALAAPVPVATLDAEGRPAA